MAYTTIDDPSAYFQTTLWTGDGNDDRSITNTGNSDLQPDFVWIKSRGTTNDNLLFNSTVGVGNYLRSNDTNTDTTIADTLQAFESDGIQIGTDTRLNTNADTVVSWQWKANAGSTSVNNSGSIQSTVQVNQDAGFSIVTYTGTGSGATVGHGLGAIPTLVMVKNRSSAQNWRVFHQDAYYNGGYGQYQSGLKLNSNAVADHGANSYWNNDAFTTSTFSVGVNTEVNGSGNSMLAYCFTEKQGYSKFGLYTGNNNADGPFVYTGFRPAWLMIKATGSTGGASAWRIADNKRSSSGGSNPVEKQLEADTNITEDSGNDVDLLSNGFKVRSTAAQWNASANYFIYMAFAEHPFVSSTGAPTTAG